MQKNSFYLAIAFVCLLMFAGQTLAHPTPPASGKSSGSNTRSRFKVQLFPTLESLTAKFDVTPVEQTRLKMRIARNEEFPPLPAFLHPGSVWDESKVIDPTASGENLWYKVPKWIAGEFSYGPITNYSKKNLVTGAEMELDSPKPGLERGRIRGILVDKAGNIWQKAYGGSIGSGRSEPEERRITYRRYDDELTGIIVSPNDYVENSAGIEFYIDHSTDKIFQVLRWQRIRNFSFKNGEVLVDLSELKFDLNGKPLMEFKDRAKMIRRQDFQPLTPGGHSRVVSSYEEAVQDLRRFMEIAGHLDEAPDAVASPAASEPAVESKSEPAEKK